MRIILFLFLCFFSCKPKSEQSIITDVQINESLTDANKHRITNEKKDIDDFILRHNYKMQRTGTGLNYELIKSTNEKSVKKNSLLTIHYKIYLLNGTLCYERDKINPQHLVLNKGQQINGIEEALMLMNKGEKIRLVIPAHLAFGFTGDDNKIPVSAALFAEVDLINVE